MIDRLKKYCEQTPPRPSYNSNAGESVQARTYAKRPEKEATELLEDGAVVVWKGQASPTSSVFPIDGYCVVDACLDSWGNTNPETLPLWPEMEGHPFEAVVFVDALGRTRMKAIGGFTSYETRNSEMEKLRQK